MNPESSDYSKHQVYVHLTMVCSSLQCCATFVEVKKMTETKEI